MGIVTVLVFIGGLAIGGLGAGLYSERKLAEYIVECSNTMSQYQSDAIESVINAEERGRWQVTQTMDAMFAKFAAATSTAESERAQIISQPDTPVPHELLLAYGVSSVGDLPEPLRAVWDKNYVGGVVSDS